MKSAKPHTAQSKLYTPWKLYRRSVYGRDANGRTQLMLDVIERNSRSIKYALKHGLGELNSQDEDGNTSLHLAIMLNYPEIVTFLLKSNCNWSLRNNGGRTAFHVAAVLEETKCLQLLLKICKPQMDEINEPDNELMTALHWAVIYNRPHNVEVLIQAGAVVAATDVDGKSPLLLTASNTDTIIANFLINKQPNIVNLADLNGKTPLHAATLENNVPLVLLLAGRSDIQINAQDAFGRTSLHYACLSGYTQLVYILLQHNAKDSIADESGATALHYAASKNHSQVVSVLLSQPNASYLPDKEGRYPLTWAVAKGHLQTTRALLEANINENHKDKSGSTALHAAAYYGQTHCAALLIEANCPVNATDIQLHTPLFRAVERGHAETATLLIQTGAVVNAFDKDGRSPLHWAALNGDLSLCSLLLANGALVDAKDLSKKTPLCCAAYNGFNEIVKFLVENGANVNIRDKDGVSPLHWAAGLGHQDLVELLLQLGCHPNPTDHASNRFTPLDYAIAAKHPECIALLQAYGGISNTELSEVSVVKIQAAWRGYRVRRPAKVLSDKNSKSKATLYLTENPPSQNRLMPSQSQHSAISTESRSRMTLFDFDGNPTSSFKQSADNTDYRSKMTLFAADEVDKKAVSSNSVSGASALQDSTEAGYFKVQAIEKEQESRGDNALFVKADTSSANDSVGQQQSVDSTEDDYFKMEAELRQNEDQVSPLSPPIMVVIDPSTNVITERSTDDERGPSEINCLDVSAISPLSAIPRTNGGSNQTLAYGRDQENQDTVDQGTVITAPASAFDTLDYQTVEPTQINEHQDSRRSSGTLPTSSSQADIRQISRTSSIQSDTSNNDGFELNQDKDLDLRVSQELEWISRELASTKKAKDNAPPPDLNRSNNTQQGDSDELSSSIQSASSRITHDTNSSAGLASLLDELNMSNRSEFSNDLNSSLGNDTRSDRVSDPSASNMSDDDRSDRSASLTSGEEEVNVRSSSSNLSDASKDDSIIERDGVIRLKLSHRDYSTDGDMSDQSSLAGRDRRESVDSLPQPGADQPNFRLRPNPLANTTGESTPPQDQESDSLDLSDSDDIESGIEEVSRMKKEIEMIANQAIGAHNSHQDFNLMEKDLQLERDKQVIVENLRRGLKNLKKEGASGDDLSIQPDQRELDLEYLEMMKELN